MRRLLLPLLAALLWILPFQSAFAGVDLNTANEGQLEGLPGIGPAKASAIIQYRNEHGPFSTVAQLDNVPGIGPATMANLNGLVSVGDGVTVAAADSVSQPERAASPVPAGALVNINTASEVELQDLPGIGPAKAAAIVAYRARAGSFARCEDLDKVEGIGPATLKGLLNRCAVSDDASAMRTD